MPLVVVVDDRIDVWEKWSKANVLQVRSCQEVDLKNISYTFEV
jgi:hypothetical protein